MPRKHQWNVMAFSQSVMWINGLFMRQYCGKCVEHWPRLKIVKAGNEDAVVQSENSIPSLYHCPRIGCGNCSNL